MAVWRWDYALTHGYELSPSGVWVKPFKGSARHFNVMLEPVEEDVVINRIKCSRELKKDEEENKA